LIIKSDKKGSNSKQVRWKEETTSIDDKDKEKRV